MATRKPLIVGEWYHCYNRGVDKRLVFENQKDYGRFLALMYVCNGSKKIWPSERYRTDLDSILTDTTLDRGDPLVSVGAYSLMPNHTHFLFQEILRGGIASYMQKIFTGYTMFFNSKYQRTGALFAGTFKSKHIQDDGYLKQIVPYVLLNPIGLFEPRWKEGVGNIKRIEKQLLEYRYSSLPDFIGGEERPEKKILGKTLRVYYDSFPSLKSMLQNAQEYYLTQSPEV